MISKRTKIMAIVIVTMFLASGIATAYAYWLHINGNIKVTATDWWYRYNDDEDYDWETWNPDYWNETGGNWSQWYHLGDFDSGFDFNISNGQNKTFVFEIHNDDTEDRYLTVYIDSDEEIMSELYVSKWNYGWNPRQTVLNGETLYWYYDGGGFVNNTYRFSYLVSVPNTCDSGYYDAELEFV